MKKNYLNYNDEMAWKERRKQIKEENLVVENKGEYAELEAIKEGYTTFDDKYDVVFYNVPSVLVRNTQNKCSILIDAVQKYLEDTYGDMEYYEVFKDRYNDELDLPRTFSIREILRDCN